MYFQDKAALGSRDDSATMSLYFSSRVQLPAPASSGSESSVNSSSRESDILFWPLRHSTQCWGLTGREVAPETGVRWVCTWIWMEERSWRELNFRLIILSPRGNEKVRQETHILELHIFVSGDGNTFAKLLVNFGFWMNASIFLHYSQLPSMARTQSHVWSARGHFITCHFRQPPIVVAINWAPKCSVCQFLWCKYSTMRLLQVPQCTSLLGSQEEITSTSASPAAAILPIHCTAPIIIIIF